MELGKSFSESQSEESDPTEQLKDEGSVKRSYECTFCKRGFTNAQALGGHMNIHRKDRAKGKQIPATAFSTNRKLSDPYSINRNPIGSVSTGVPANYDLEKEEEGQRRNHEGLIRASASVPLSSTSCSESYFSIQSFHSSTRSSHDVILDANLSLRIGPSSTECITEVKRDEKRDEIDLELRLGRSP